MVKKGSAIVDIDVDVDEQARAEEARQRAADWAIIERIGERNKHLDPDEVLRHVTEIVEEVRQELYEEEQRAKAAHRR